MSDKLEIRLNSDPAKSKFVINGEKRTVKSVWIGIDGKPVLVWDRERGLLHPTTKSKGEKL